MTLRKPFFILAMVLLALVVLLELGAAPIQKAASSGMDLAQILPDDPEVWEAFLSLSGEERETLTRLSQARKPPGRAIGMLALVDGILLFTLVLMGLSLIWGPRLHGRLQGALTLAFAILLLLLVIAAVIAAIAALILMLTLLAAVPFGTLVYLARYGFFNRTAAAFLLGLVGVLKLGAGGGLILAHPRFLQNRGLILMFLTSFLAMAIISFLHGLVPRFLVSITDAIAAIIVGILAGVWSVWLGLGGIRAILRAARLS